MLRDSYSFFIFHEEKGMLPVASEVLIFFFLLYIFSRYSLQYITCLVTVAVSVITLGKMIIGKKWNYRLIDNLVRLIAPQDLKTLHVLAKWIFWEF